MREKKGDEEKGVEPLRLEKERNKGLKGLEGLEGGSLCVKRELSRELVVPSAALGGLGHRFGY